MQVFIVRDTDPAALEEKINKKLDEIEDAKIFENVKVQYQATTAPQMRGDKITGYKIEYSALISFDTMQFFREGA
jgi:hypothetical protein